MIVFYQIVSHLSPQNFTFYGEIPDPLDFDATLKPRAIRSSPPAVVAPQPPQNQDNPLTPKPSSPKPATNPYSRNLPKLSHPISPPQKLQLSSKPQPAPPSSLNPYSIPFQPNTSTFPSSCQLEGVPNTPDKKATILFQKQLPTFIPISPLSHSSDDTSDTPPKFTCDLHFSSHYFFSAIFRPIYSLHFPHDTLVYPIFFP